MSEGDFGRALGDLQADVGLDGIYAPTGERMGR
jgi:hypothetical protein